ncbi:MotA/TolQ/ExbB proton channel family protein [Wenzhouxiangella sp. EGI_FJ10305]|uniref:MotA/TolQ/ExbB proton channel family protein n=1 Tax=Wenzhouxiangella sp. EGI_FJ10305 TaxID=3243768 RepID=UPI0035DCA9E2
MSIRISHILILLAGVWLAAPVISQDEPAQPEAEQAAQAASQSDPDTEAGQSEPEERPVAAQAPSLEQAFQREFAFLQGQKRDLERRIAEFEETSEADRQQLQSDIQSLERRVVELTSRGDRLDEQVLESERSVESARDNVNLLANTFLQAEATIDGWEAPQLEGDEVPQTDDVAAMFETVRKELKRRGAVQRESGEFFLADGTRVDGEIIHVGRIASFGVSERGAGALAPAGEGELKLWNEDSAEAARTLAAGTMVSPLPIFIYETLSSEVEEKGSKGVFETISSGGVIGWIIFFLGLLAAALVALRALFLWRAGTSTGRILDDVAAPVRRGDREAALSMLKKRKGATARVVASAIRNLDRDREHLEDIVSESILHESGHLNRFGAFIMVIAAVSPLLGLLGTVTGMISTFDVITEFGTGDPKLLSGGISIALVTTELGLIVAIPTLLFGNLLSSWAERIKDDMEKATLRVTNQYLEARGDTEQVGG